MQSGDGGGVAKKKWKKKAKTQNRTQASEGLEGREAKGENDVGGRRRALATAGEISGETEARVWIPIGRAATRREERANWKRGEMSGARAER